MNDGIFTSSYILVFPPLPLSLFLHSLPAVFLFPRLTSLSFSFLPPSVYPCLPSRSLSLSSSLFLPLSPCGLPFFFDLHLPPSPSFLSSSCLLSLLSSPSLPPSLHLPYTPPPLCPPLAVGDFSPFVYLLSPFPPLSLHHLFPLALPSLRPPFILHI